ncbi:Ros/MucR family transcriptional regulator [Pseudaminobacter sp. NGMCC 1.201702]|uniref:MucR family transcriptional regulator n=1 Tax=Pseudaminobacter sp. NGMCC 1.201702 TaxID=3391825 RepID=UPI0039EDFC7C
MNHADASSLDKATFPTLAIAANIVSAYVSNNPIPATELPALIDRVNAALVNLSEPAPVRLVDEPRTPAISIKRSVTRSHIFCLEDGKKFKSLKRHLMVHHNMSPEEYRERWDLPSDYPVVAPEYAASRSAMAKAMGLGRKRAAKSSTSRDRKSD